LKHKALSLALILFVTLIATGQEATPRRKPPSASHTPGVVSWVHIGDLHITTETEQNYSDFQTLVQQANQFLKDSGDFAYLPGDNANEGSEPEYQLIKKVTDQLQIPLLVVPGDHDVHSGSVDLFLKYLSPLPYQSFTLDQYHMIFLNALDATGPDGKPGFGFGQKQMDWLRGELKETVAKKQQPILFLHSFPEALGPSKQDLIDLIKENKVLLVEVGHTHFNALSSDGQTLYAATRSTGQVKEGPVGFSITNLDNGVVSWKFKPIGDWPFVMITSPSDKRFVTNPGDHNQIIRGIIGIHTKVFGGQAIESAMYSIDDGESKPLSRSGDSPLWTAKWDSTKVDCGDHMLKVTVKAKDGKVAEDQAIITVNQKAAYIPAPRLTGADNNSIGVDPERGLLGTTQGPGGKPPWAGKGKADEPKEGTPQTQKEND
jgi:hypothetical protein